MSAAKLKFNMVPKRLNHAIVRIYICPLLLNEKA
jgi:hypothetical protein